MPALCQARRRNVYRYDAWLICVPRDQNAENVVHEMVRASIRRLADKRGQPHVTKKEILMVLYKTKMNLPDDNPVKKDLAYYWYRKGPYSERVNDALHSLVASDVVSHGKTKQCKGCRPGPKHTVRPPAPPSDDLDTARRELDDVVDGFVDLKTIVTEIYRDHAPYEWYAAYKEEFKPKFRTYCNAILQSRPTSHTPKDVIRWLDRIVVEYPPLPEFIEHRRIVMDFSKMLHAVMGSDPHHEHKDLLRELHGLCGRIWEVFAYGVRLKYHDEHYEDRVEEWKRKYWEAVSKLDEDIREQVTVFGRIVQDNVRLAPDIVAVLENPDTEDLERVTPESILNEC